jgi:hydrogenase expression/formation protein HypD
MKHVDAFRDQALAARLAARIAAAVDPARTYRFMEFCGGHTHAIARFGLADLLPPNVRLIHGPGCPVCVLPIGRIDQAIRAALEHRVILATYGDLMRVPASAGLSLLRAKARGADVRMVWSAADALALARAHPDREVVFLAIGFETTTPPTALAIRAAADPAGGVGNFSVLCNHMLTPPAIAGVLGDPGARVPGNGAIDGLIGPAHVSVVIGTRPYEPLARRHRTPVVVTGFEPLDLLQAVSMLVRQVGDGRAQVENEFTRAVTRDGNRIAQQVTDAVFEPRERFAMRGLGEVAGGGLRIRPAFAALDAERRFALEDRSVPDPPKCECPAVLRGTKSPADCRLFGTACTPQTPLGACMVSSEGSCAAHWTYGRFRHPGPQAAAGAGSGAAAAADRQAGA